MSDETRRRCFEPFFTTKGVEGTGLGLAVSWSIARRHGGDLTALSEPNAGSTFVLWLPLSAGPVEAPPSPPAWPGRPLKVMVVDDQPTVGRAVVRMIESLGHAATFAGSGQDAIARLTSEPVDVVLTDLGMPEVDGFAIAAAAKQLRANLPVVILTGWGPEVSLPDRWSPAVDYILAKPPTLATLAEALQLVADPMRDLEQSGGIR